MNVGVMPCFVPIDLTTYLYNYQQPQCNIQAQLKQLT